MATRRSSSSSASAIVRVLIVRSNRALVAPEHLDHRPVDRGQRQNGKERSPPRTRRAERATARGLSACTRRAVLARRSAKVRASSTGVATMVSMGRPKQCTHADIASVVPKSRTAKPFLSPTSLTPGTHAPRVRPPCENFSQRQPSRRRLADAFHPSRRESCARGPVRRRGKGWRVCPFPIVGPFRFGRSSLRRRSPRQHLGVGDRHRSHQRRERPHARSVSTSNRPI